MYYKGKRLSSFGIKPVQQNRRRYLSYVYADNSTLY